MGNRSFVGNGDGPHFAVKHDLGARVLIATDQLPMKQADSQEPELMAQ